MTALVDFLVRLSIDPAALADFVREPAAVIERAGLDQAGRRALTSGSAAALWNHLLGKPPVEDLDGAVPEGPLINGADRGSLVVVGTGIRTVGHITLEAIAWMMASDVVLYLVADPIAEGVIRHLNPDGAMSLRGYYGEGVARTQSYEAMVQHILSCIRAGKKTCVAFYGHPGVFAYPSHESVRRARLEGYPARMLPGVSAEDCLFADLGVDPAVSGCLSIEASDFLLHEKLVDTTGALVLWQVGVVGDWTYRSHGYHLGAFPLLVAKLVGLYGAAHESFVYEAATMPGLPPRITQIALVHLSPAYVNAGSTLYVPPLRPKVLNREVAAALGAIR